MLKLNIIIAKASLFLKWVLTFYNVSVIIQAIDKESFMNTSFESVPSIAKNNKFNRLIIGTTAAAAIGASALAGCASGSASHEAGAQALPTNCATGEVHEGGNYMIAGKEAMQQALAEVPENVESNVLIKTITLNEADNLVTSAINQAVKVGELPRISHDGDKLKVCFRADNIWESVTADAVDNKND